MLFRLLAAVVVAVAVVAIDRPDDAREALDDAREGGEAALAACRLARSCPDE